LENPDTKPKAMRLSLFLKRFLFFCLAGFTLAAGAYYVLVLLMPDGRVFGSVFRMYLYHLQFPLQYIFIPCFFYAIIASAFSRWFAKSKLTAQLFIMTIIIVLTILISSPVGGMLWYYHDMDAGHFPESWFSKMVEYGFVDGLGFGWLIIGLSFPYNLVCCILAFFLTRKGSEWFERMNGHKPAL
jgi:hypothetical protein